ncbi:MAG: TetR family transcriptional regulator [Pseudonocardiales bacterium]|nr:TetR family transcriptional regulator [Pseudonocardiales bacterium]
MTTIDDDVHPSASNGRVDGDGQARPMRKDAARNRELLISAGREVFARRGLEASLDDVARHAGVGIGTAYRHFANKFGLAEAIMHDALGQVLAAAERALEVEDPWLGLTGFLEAVLEVQTKDLGLREVMMGAHAQRKSDDDYEALQEPISAILQRAQRSGTVRADVSVTDLGCVLAMLCEVADLAGDVAPHLWRRYLPTLLAGLRPGGPELPAVPLTDTQFRVAYDAHHSLRNGAVPRTR